MGCSPKLSALRKNAATKKVHSSKERQATGICRTAVFPTSKMSRARHFTRSADKILSSAPADGGCGLKNFRQLPVVSGQLSVGLVSNGRIRILPWGARLCEPQQQEISRMLIPNAAARTGRAPTFEVAVSSNAATGAGNKSLVMSTAANASSPLRLLGRN